MSKDLKIKTGTKSKVINVDYLARVEGEGALHIATQEGEVTDVQLKIFEPPRFFEAFLRGRSALEAPDITARICGICPVAYMMSSIHAIENAFNMKISDQIRRLRRLLYCGEWIESHTLHVIMLHAPDFFRLNDAVGLAKLHRDKIEAGLKLKRAGNRIVEILGGREIHPVNVKVGGFYKLPDKSQFESLAEDLKHARECALEITRWVAGFNFPELERNYEFVSVAHEAEYPMNEGLVTSNLGLAISATEFEQHFEEIHVPYTNALHSIHKGYGSYCVGPFARYNLHREQLCLIAKQQASDLNFMQQCFNPSKTIIMRALEVVHAVDEAINIIESIDFSEPVCVETTVRAGVGTACTEAPRGTLYHKYEIDKEGNIVNAKIIPPTSQNQKMIEDDLSDLVKLNISLPEDELTWACEQAVRNYDPCISCATHFLKVKINEQ